MSWLFFLDESGHDHKQMPYEVRGGVAIHASQLWPFVRAAQQLELACFGCQLHLYRKEIKGSTLLDKKRFRFAHQDDVMPSESRQKHCRTFLAKGLAKTQPTREEFTAYGQACLEMASGIFQLLHDHDAKVFAGAIPKNITKPSSIEADSFLRKDHVFLFERFFYHLDAAREHGILVMDEVEKTEDARFVRRMERYFTRTDNGRLRTTWIVPTPFFVSSDLTYAVQAADLCIYCINWGFRVPAIGMDSDEVRPEIADRYGAWLSRLQFCGEGRACGNAYPSYGIFFVPDPYTPR